MKLATVISTVLAAAFGATMYAQSLEVTVQTPGLKTIKVPVVLTGKQLKEKIGATDGKLLTVTGKSGKKYASQLDARDKNGNYIKQAGATLNDEDEFVFLANPAQDETYTITVGTAAAPAQETIKVSDPKDNFSDLKLTNTEKLSISIKSSVPASAAKRVKADFSKGGIVITSDKTTVTSTGTWTNMTAPIQPLGRDVGGTSWSKPEIVAEGPVRKIVRITWKQDTSKNLVINGIFTFKGFTGKAGMENLFCLYAEGGIIDCTETIRYAKMNKKARLQWGLPLNPGGSKDADKELILPDADKVQVMPLKDIDQKFEVKNNIFCVYASPVQGKTADGYYGLYNPVKKIGVAAFYQTSATQDNKSYFEIRIAPVSLFKNKGSGTVNSTIAYDLAGSKTDGAFKTSFRIVSFKDQTPDFVRQSYMIWNAPETFIKVK